MFDKHNEPKMDFVIKLQEKIESRMNKMKVIDLKKEFGDQTNPQ